MLSLPVSHQKQLKQSDESCLARKLPPIAFVNIAELPYWNAESYHAVVVVGIQGDQVFIHDPAFDDAPKHVSIDEFMLAWIGMEQFYALIESHKHVEAS